MENQEIVVTSDQQLSGVLLSLENNFEQAARRNVQSALGTDFDQYTETEVSSMVVIEQLKLINGIDLAAVLMRGKLINVIEERGLWATHPGGYSSLQEMASDQGISMSELSNVRTLCNVIFPYMENVLEVNVAEAWEKIGKSNFRDLASVLRGLITGENGGRSSVNQAVTRILEDVHATFQSSHSDDEELSDEDATRIAVSQLLENSEGMTNREIRQRIRPERTPSINMNFIKIGDRKYALAEVSGDQEVLLQNRLHGYIDPISVEISDDPSLRQIQATRIREIRAIMSVFGVA